MLKCPIFILFYFFICAVCLGRMFVGFIFSFSAHSIADLKSML
jgi:hypothetical protein